MRRVRRSRSENPDLLPRTRPGKPSEDPWVALLIDPAAQLAELTDLVDRGLVSPEQFELQRQKIFDRS